MDVLVELVKTFGFPVALAVYYIYQNTKDKAQTEARFAAIEEFCRTSLVEIAKDSTKAALDCGRALDKSNGALEKNSRVIEENSRTLAEFKAFLSVNSGNK